MTVPQILKVRTQAAALFSAMEQYQRRNETCPVRLVGALLGAVTMEADSNQFVAEVRHCFPIPHSEFGDQVSINSEYYRTRMELHRKCYARDSILLGWYSIQAEGVLPKGMDAATFAKNSEFIQEFFARETGAGGAPVALNLSINIGKDGSIEYSAARCDSVLPGSGSTSRTCLEPVNCEIVYGVPELYCLDAARQALLNTEPGQGGRLRFSVLVSGEHRDQDQAAVARIIESLKKYQEEVRAGLREEIPELRDCASDLLKTLGCSIDGDVDLQQVVAENQKSLAKAVNLLGAQLDISDHLFLGQPFNNN